MGLLVAVVAVLVTAVPVPMAAVPVPMAAVTVAAAVPVPMAGLGRNNRLLQFSSMAVLTASPVVSLSNEEPTPVDPTGIEPGTTPVDPESNTKTKEPIFSVEEPNRAYF